MNAPTPLAESPSLTRRLLVVARGVFRACVLILVFVLLKRCVTVWQATRALTAIQNRINAEDTAWEWPQIVAEFKVRIFEPNSADCVLAAAEHLKPKPEHWQLLHTEIRVPDSELESATPEDYHHNGPWDEYVFGVPANHRLLAHEIEEVRARLVPFQAASREARKVAKLPHGRYAVDWAPIVSQTLLPHLQRARSVARLVALDAVVNPAEANPNLHLQILLAGLNVGESIGEEPTLIAQLVRLACLQSALKNIERTLGQTELPRSSLICLQNALDAVDLRPGYLQAVRGERAALADLFHQIYTGALSLNQLQENASPSKATMGQGFQSWLVGRPTALATEAHVLELMTPAVEVARVKDLFDGQVLVDRAMDEVMEATRSPDEARRAAAHIVPAWGKVFFSLCRAQAYLDSMRLAVAIERYRQEQGCWPLSLGELKPRYLSNLPTDPFSGKEYQYLRTGSGVVIYSVGLNLLDDNGQVFNGAGADSPDFGYRLWSPRQRGVFPFSPVP